MSTVREIHDRMFRWTNGETFVVETQITGAGWNPAGAPVRTGPGWLALWDGEDAPTLATAADAPDTWQVLRALGDRESAVEATVSLVVVDRRLLATSVELRP